MTYLLQFGLIMGICALSQLLNNTLPLPIPASIYGFLLLFVLLASGILKLHWIRQAGRILLKIMPVLFVPALVCLSSSELLGAFLPVLIAILIITPIVMLVSGYVTQTLLRIRKGKKDE